MEFIFDPSLVLYLPLYELDGASFMSKDAYRHLCTATGASWRPNGHYLDGADDYISVPNQSALDFAGKDKLAVEIWLNPTDWLTGQTYSYLVDQESVSGFFFRRGTTYIDFRIHNGGWAGSVKFATSLVPVGSFYHIFAQYTGSQTEIYLNGELQDTTTVSGNITGGSGATWIGIYSVDAASREFNGTIGEVRIYSRALTPLEIQHNYLATKWRYR